jgi:hypothetical protein
VKISLVSTVRYAGGMDDSRNDELKTLREWIDW